MWVLLLATLLAPAPPAWRVVLLVPPDQAVTAAEQQQAARTVAGALAWWQARGQPVPEIASVTTVLLPANALTHPPDVGVQTIAILQTDDLLLGSHRGVATPGRVWVVSAAENLPAVLTHELGHALYGLPDWPGCHEVDIMCWPDVAYPVGLVGCRTLAALEQPCHTVMLPTVVR